MAEHRLSVFQRIARAFTSAGTFAAMEADFACLAGEMPRMRLRALDLGAWRHPLQGDGRSPRTLMRCPRCGARGWHKVEKRAE